MLRLPPKARAYILYKGARLKPLNDWGWLSVAEWLLSDASAYNGLG